MLGFVTIIIFLNDMDVSKTVSPEHILPSSIGRITALEFIINGYCPSPVISSINKNVIGQNFRFKRV